MQISYDIGNSSFDGGWLSVPEGKESAASQGVSIPVPMPDDRRFHISIGIRFLSPQTGVRFIDIGKASNAMIWKAVDEAVAQGKTPVEQDEPHQVLVGSACFEGEFDENMEVSHPLNAAEAFAEYANMSIVSTMKEEFWISW